MKKIELTGGLGNQMFQYAYGRKKELSGDKILFLKKFTKERKYLLDSFNIKTKSNMIKMKENILSKIKNKFYIYLKLDTIKYYQNEKYFKNIENIIREEFNLKNPLIDVSKKWEEDIKSSPISVSIHIRRGDYVNNPKTNKYHGICGIEYYKKAINLLENKIGKNFEIFIFSDDIKWTKNNLSFNQQMNFVSSPEIPDYEEMYLMSLCKHNIIANSTFSWWGAWLNKNPNKIVIGPEQWFNKKTIKNIMPSKWIKI